MLPIALTCPVWWVARWTARMVASLAVVVACSLGAATLPLGPAAMAHEAPRPVAVDTAALPAGPAGPAGTDLAPALRAGHAGTDPALRVVIRWSGRATEAAAGAGTGAPDAAVRIGTGSSAAAGWAASGSHASGSHASGSHASGSHASGDRPALPVGVPDPLARGVVVAPADRHHVLAGLVPAAVGSRAPPAR